MTFGHVFFRPLKVGQEFERYLDGLLLSVAKLLERTGQFQLFQGLGSVI